MWNPITYFRKRRETRNRLILRRTINQFKRNDSKMEKNKKNLIDLAAQARREGAETEYRLAINGLMNVIRSQKLSRRMAIHLGLAENVLDLQKMGREFTTVMGRVGRDLTRIAGEMNVAGNQMAFEQGMLATEESAGALEDFLEDAGMTFEDQVTDEEELRSEVERLIDSASAAGGTEEDDIDRRLAEAARKRASLEE